MRRITPPPYSFSEVFDICVSTVDNNLKRQNFTSIRQSLLDNADTYITLASSARLHQIASIYGPDSTLTHGNISKGDLRGLYTGQLRPKTKTARKYYDQLVVRSSGKRCPFCGFNQARTLDHYLPHSLHPDYSILPQNLIPCCGDCNGIKNNSAPTTEEELSINPYYDQDIFFNEQWLYASIIQEPKFSVSYHTSPPDGWSDINKNRVRNHLDNYELNLRYPIEAANELISIISSLKLISPHSPAPSHIVRAELQQAFLSEVAININSWKSAMYQALTNHNWFYEGGYFDLMIDDSP